MTSVDGRFNPDFIKAFIKFKKKLRPAKYNAKNPHFNSEYANIESCDEATRDLLADNGFTIFQTTKNEADGSIYLETVLSHESGSHLTSSMYVAKNTQSPQQIGSALTYMRRYSLITVTGLVSGDDDDGNAAESDNKDKQEQKNTNTKKINFEEAMKIKCGPGKYAGRLMGDMTLAELDQHFNYLKGLKNKKPNQWLEFDAANILIAEYENPKNDAPDFNSDEEIPF